MKIVDFESFKNTVNKLDKMAQPDEKPITVFQSDKSVSEKMKKFFEIADGGNPSWNV